ncbi:CBM35 domain-containing protein [Streptomyces sp. NPDC006475]|uniref:alpha-galactosidase D n=1 Tax=Streptomyces sp. NPDC006475 TaxID=3155719 RepID=UPI0033B61DA7
MLSPAAFTSGAVALAVATALTSAAPPTGPTASAQRPAATVPAAPAPATQDARTQEAPAQDALAQKPYMGWTSWSMQSSKYPGLNPRGEYSYLTEANVLKQADAMAAKLKPYGYEYVNIDAGWWRDWQWKPHFDAYGRQQADPERFPSGMKAVADRLHRKGLKAGIYLPVGLEKEAYGEGKVPVWNAPGCTTGDIVHSDLRTTNGWDSAYKIDFSQACAQKYIDSQAQLFADWGYDFLKIDGVGPGSFKSGDNYDNRADIAAWKQAIATAGRPIHLELSWSLDVNYIADWKKHSNGWRIDTDVECYCNTLVTWDNSVEDRWRDTPAWTRHGGPGGFNDLDSLNVGNGAMDGLTKAERQSYMTLWAISKSPLYTGDDITGLDSYGLSLLTNREVLKLNQQASPAARPLTAGDRQVWGAKNPDGTYTVALFNLGDTPAAVTADWSSLGFGGRASVRDVWNKENLGRYNGGITQAVPAHGSRLFVVQPGGPAPAMTAYEAEAPANTLAGSASVAGCDECSGGKKVGNLYVGGSLRFNEVVVKKAGTYVLNVSYTSGDPRQIRVGANGAPGATWDFPSSGGWGAAERISVPVTLKAGSNTITFDSGSGYSPDIDRIDVPQQQRS